MSRFCQLLASLLLCELLVTVSASKYRICEPYLDAAKKYHSGFHCPRLNEDQRQTHCCHQSNQTLKYCCNEAEFQSTMKMNKSAQTRSSVNYGSMAVVFVYGLCVVALLLTDLLHYYMLNRHNLWWYQPPHCLCGCCNGDHKKTSSDTTQK
ncbi:protein shisa-like-1 [Rhincodon typus]|uniref:protein shisa-like-1 n=1 Tax=Rhincodon typus TaxID=259920 RepID=UPI0020304E5B|nr:protein shisa-like-1 [Rhincodon typus]